MLSIKAKWVKIATNRNELFKLLGERDAIPYRFSNKAAMLIWHDERFYLVKNKCPHQNVKLTGAHCVKGHIVCPFHKYAFNLETGLGNGLYLENYRVEERAEGIYAEVEYFSWF